jgi:hypothetical protein
MSTPTIPPADPVDLDIREYQAWGGKGPGPYGPRLSPLDLPDALLSAAEQAAIDLHAIEPTATKVVVTLAGRKNGTITRLTFSFGG